MSQIPPRDMEPLTLLISHDRSGSHYLASFLKSLPNSRIVDEVCNEDALDPATNPLSFFGFRHDRSKKNPDYALRRNPRVVEALLDEYFGFVVEQASGAKVTVDIKYGHVHNFEAAWCPALRRPFLFEYARRNKICIIHLSRWNSLEAVISGFVAESRRTWHATGDKRPAQASEAIEVDIRHLGEQVAALDEQKAIVFRWSRGLRCLPVTYEELVHPGTEEQTRRRIASFLDVVAPATFQSPYRKVTPPLAAIVRNWDEVKRFCRDNGLSHYLLPVLPGGE